MDFITHLSQSHGFTTILVVVDRYSKGVHCGALPSSYFAYKVVSSFLDLVCKHHGYPRSIVSNRDPVFLSSFWCELFRLSGTRLRISTVYHPQIDGQTEVMNRVLKQYLSSFVHLQPTNWFHYLSLAEWSYNTSLHSRLSTASRRQRYLTIYQEQPLTKLWIRCSHPANNSMKGVGDHEETRGHHA